MTSVGPRPLATHEEQWRGVQHKKRKTYRYIAVVALLIRPQDADARCRVEELQEMRSTYDAAYQRWEPHVTLVPPFELSIEAERGALREGQASAKRFTHSVDEGSAKADGSLAPAAFSHVQCARTSNESEPAFRDPERMERGIWKDRAADISLKIQRAVTTHEPFKLVFDTWGAFKVRAYTTVHLKPRTDGWQPRDAPKRSADECLDDAASPSLDATSNAPNGHAEVCALQRDIEIALPESEDCAFRRGGSNTSKGGGGGRSKGAPRSKESGAANSQRSKEHAFKPHLTAGQYNVSYEQKAGQSVQERDAKRQDVIRRATDLTSDPTRCIHLEVDRVFLLGKPIGRPGPYDIWDEISLKAAAP
ncbi:hypothetical protein IE81DRAFT_348415 [Ceraceosorus guamensis]|uniref:Uncharacterized protein n=1 Tax=Ceraceosorus guamensis TaxID=1522189 RepID=A0A316VUR8_9BASI|nr:hypothetical protein IE81DRAFT_348415 [Ceraceosorus guamensis]PWN41366.1 hypothetical protein IE81DRAFT_348415 [Ceraceosorus guamensis]